MSAEKVCSYFDKNGVSKDTIEEDVESIESAPVAEQKVMYDLRFRIESPRKTVPLRIFLHIDFEMQQQYATGYDLVARGVYYSARMLNR